LRPGLSLREKWENIAEFSADKGYDISYVLKELL
jgi:hypothetical protein